MVKEINAEEYAEIINSSSPVVIDFTGCKEKTVASEYLQLPILTFFLFKSYFDPKACAASSIILNL